MRFSSKLLVTAASTALATAVAAPPSAMAQTVEESGGEGQRCAGVPGNDKDLGTSAPHPNADIAVAG